MRRKTEDWPDNNMAMVEKRLIKNQKHPRWPNQLRSMLLEKDQCAIVEKRDIGEKMNALIADREEGANPQHNRMRLMGLGLHTIEPPETHNHRKSMGQSSLVPSGYQPLPPSH